MRPSDADSGLPVSDITTSMAAGGSGAWRVHYRSLRRREAGEDVIVLSVGDPDFDTPPAVVDAAVQALRESDTHYTVSGGVGPLANAIAALEADRLGCAVTPSQVVTAVGAQNALYVLFRALLDAGDEAILLSPPYTMFAGLASACDATCVEVPLDASAGFALDAAAVARAITPCTRLVLANFPHNPSGACADRDALLELVELCREHDIWLVSDEAYADLVYEGEFTSPASLPTSTSHVVVVRSLSKSHAMTGWRIGWTVSTPSLAVHLRNLISHVSYGSPGFIQAAGVTAITGQLSEPAIMKATYRARRDAFVSALGEIGQLRVLPPQAGIFCMVDVSGTGLDGESFSERLLNEADVSVLMGGAFSPDIAQFVRVSLCEPEERLLEATTRIRRFVASLNV
ncbi:MAG: arginine--pyruvate aminotransferase AruH [Gammaproteobacteria bacterium]|nr:arginine--pyruvate aminotransferase AruH [Gammaproteobacteria bacterium]